jgi:hypothetical protein
MSSTLKLSPAAAGRMYRGPRFHRSRGPQENRRIIREQIRKFKASAEAGVHYLGVILEAIAGISQKQQV